MKRFLYFTLLFMTSLLSGAEPGDQFVQAHDAKLYCHEIGKGDLIIAIHGGPGLSQGYLRPGLEALGKDHRVIFYDQRNCGQSEGPFQPDMVNIEIFVQDLEAVLQASGEKSCTLLGHSWGGFLAMHYAIAHPEKVNRLILSNSMTSSSDDLQLFLQEWMKRTEPMRAEIEQIKTSEAFQKGDLDAIENYYRLLFRTYCYHTENADKLNLRFTPNDRVSSIMTEKYFFTPYNLHPQLQQLPMPTLVIHGDTDPIPPATAFHTHESIPHSQWVLLNNCGHFPYVEVPDAYFQAIRNFLNDPKP